MHFPGTVNTSLENTEMKPQQRYLMLKRKHPVMTALLQDCRVPLFSLSLTSGIKRDGKLKGNQMNWTISLYLFWGKDWELQLLFASHLPFTQGSSLVFWVLDNSYQTSLAHGIALMAEAVGCLLSVPSPPLVLQSRTFLGCSVCSALASLGMTKMFWNLKFHAAPVKGHISVGNALGESHCKVRDWTPK